MKARLAAGAVALTLAFGPVTAKVPAEKARELDSPSFTCMGAERAGSASGIPEYAGTFVGSWPGMTKKSGWQPGPYAAEKPLFSITAENAAQYEKNLTEGQKGLLKKYPKAFRMDVYPSHRDFGYPAKVCEIVKSNATSAEVIHDGLGIAGTSGGIPFPFPQSGIEAVWNIINPYRAFNEQAVVDIADVYANGSIAWGKQKFMTMDPGKDLSKKGSYQDKIGAYFYTSYILPERDKGFTAVGYQPNDFSKDATSSWQYLPGLRRVRQAPEVGFDYPVPPAGLRTVDDDYVFNGSPERYTWKLVGKAEMYVPYHNFKANSTEVRYQDLIKPSTINPDYMRYELHRVWIVEGTLKPGVRHIYGKRRLYADEDTWMALWADNYDARGQLWRVATVAYFYSPESSAFHRGLSLYHDLSSGAYEAGYLTNEAGDKWWKINQPGVTPAMFSPEAAARGGR